MGRPSKLTPTQWDEIGRRLAGGESAAALGREFKVSQTVISLRFSKDSKAKVKALATQLAALPVKEHTAVVNLADELRTISVHLAGAARFGSATAHRLAGIAHGKVAEIDDAAPMTDESFDVLKGIATLTRMSNEAAATGLNLLNANKDKDPSKGAAVPLELDGSDVHG